MERKMAKPIQTVIEMSREEAQRFLDDILSQRPNPAKDRLFTEARKINLQMR